MDLTIGTQFSHYEIRSLLGKGGMGEVYLARDLKLRRQVALKILPGQFSLKEERLRRFEQEAYAASALNHPNILTIYEIGEANNTRFIAAEFVDGLTLRERLLTTRMDLAEMLQVICQVSSALAVAHQAGIVHRDLKPENIMIRPDGYVKILDFGLAKLTESEAILSQPEAETIAAARTKPGLVLGTVNYMSPEQVRGLSVDERSDLWAVGVLIYEIVTSTLPFDGATEGDVIASILKTEALPLSYFTPEAPAELQRIVKRALRKNREHRYLTARDLVIDLENLRRDRDSQRERGPVFEPRAISVAILPFRNLTNDATVSFYEFSLADAVITELVRLRSLIVRPSSVISRYVGQAHEPLVVGRELKVEAVLTASFLHTSARIRVTAQLLNTATGEILWGDRIDSDAGDILSVQDLIAQRIVEGLQPQLGSDEQVDLAGHATDNAAAYEEYLRGRNRIGKYVYHTVAQADVEAAIRHFQKAVELDPKFALAYCGLGGCYVQRVLKGAGKFTDLLQAREAFNKGLSIDSRIVEARVYMVFVYLTQHEKGKARAQVAELLREVPNIPSVHFVSGLLHRLDGNYERALESYSRALALNPGERVVISWCRAHVLTYQGRSEEALRELDQGMAVEPNHSLLKVYGARALQVRGDTEAACELFSEVLSEHPDMDGVRPLFAQSLSERGEHAAARAQLTDRVKEVALLDHDVPYWLASAYAMEGEDEEALNWLERAISLGNENLPWFKIDPAWQSLRQHPRFIGLMQELEAHRQPGSSVSGAPEIAN